MALNLRFSLSTLFRFSCTDKPTALLNQSFYANVIQAREIRRHTINYRRKLRVPFFHAKKKRALPNEELTASNISFVKEVVHDKYGPPAIIGGVSTYQQSPLKIEPWPRGEWQTKSRRTGVIARKIGVYPLWLKNGKRVLTTLLQVVDNHVIRYIPPEDYKPRIHPNRRKPRKTNLGCLVVGAESADPQLFTKEYCGLFTESGLMPKRLLTRFRVTADAKIQPGTPLYANHFRVGDAVDVSSKTIYHGFQGVVKRWGFKGGPASHGVTKTHRRPGNIGGGGEKARVWPGTKLPGDMGGRFRTHRGLKIMRINTKYNVLYVLGHAVPGPTNQFCYVYDTFLPQRKFENPPFFPTFYPEDMKDPLDDDIYDESVHPFEAPTITFEEVN